MVEVKLKIPEQVHKLFLSRRYTTEHYQAILLNGLCSELENLATEIAEDVQNILNDLYGIIEERNKKPLLLEPL